MMGFDQKIRSGLDRWIFVFFLLSARVVGAANELPLPAWGPGQNASPSAGLFPSDSPNQLEPAEKIPNPPLRPLLEPLELEPLVVLGEGTGQEIEEFPSGPWEEEVPLEYLQEYRIRPSKYLINPQHLLSEPQEFDLIEGLEYHASESGIPIYLLVADSGQRMPDRFILREYVDSWFPDSPACVVLYYLGLPKRSEVVLSPPLRNSAGGISGAEILEHASADALVASDPVDQLSRFAVRTSIRMFWLEKRLRDPTSMAAAIQGNESIAAAVVDTLGRVFMTPKFYVLLVSFVVLFVVLRNAIFWWAGRPGGQVHIFPEIEADSRFGAPYSGGSNIVMEFEPKE